MNTYPRMDYNLIQNAISVTVETGPDEKWSHIWNKTNRILTPALNYIDQT